VVLAGSADFARVQRSTYTEHALLVVSRRPPVSPARVGSLAGVFFSCTGDDERARTIVNHDRELVTGG